MHPGGGGGLPSSGGGGSRDEQPPPPQPPPPQQQQRGGYAEGGARGGGNTLVDLRTGAVTATGGEVRQVGRVRVHVSEVLGRGRSGTIVLMGSFEGKRAAVKVVPKRRPNTPEAAAHSALIARREAELMDLCENENAHPNVLRLFGCEEDASQFYLAQELCAASLHDLISAAREPATLSASTRGLLSKLGLWPPPLQQLALPVPLRRWVSSLFDGLSHLHALGILHCKLRPSAVLINSAGILKLSGLGLGRREAGVEQTRHDSRQAMRDAMADDGFEPPEVVRARYSAQSDRLPPGAVLHGGGARSHAADEDDAVLSVPAKKAADIFSAGVLLYWSLTCGLHPFGEDSATRRKNVLRGEPANLGQLKRLPEAQHLMMHLLHPDAERRLSAASARLHPALWEDEQKLLFVRCVSDEPELTEEHSHFVHALEDKGKAIFGTDGWGGRLHAELLAVLTAHRSYQHTCVRDLLRAVRNCDHLQGMPPEVQRLLLPRPAGIARYFLPRFPALFWSLYSLVEHHWQKPQPRRVFEPFFAWCAGEQQQHTRAP
jgi:serine/threonine-protein kinase/endoribonuclease IRE1